MKRHTKIDRRTGRRRLSAALTIGIAVSLAAIAVWFSGLDKSLELKTLDLRFRIRGELKPNPDIKMVFIGDNDIAALGRWPWSREYHALFLHALASAQPRAIFYDLLFTEKSRDTQEDLSLAEAARSTGNVFLPYYFNNLNAAEKVDESTEAQVFGNQGTWSLPCPLKLQKYFLKASQAILPIRELEGSVRHIGYANAPTDDDGVTRRVPLLVNYGGRLYPSIAFIIACDLWGVSSPEESININPGKEITVLGNDGKIHKIPVDKNCRMLVNYSGAYDAFKWYGFGELLYEWYAEIESGKPSKKLSDINNSVLVVGVNATGIGDIRPTPFEPSYPMMGFVANTLDNLLRENYLKELPRLIVVLSLFVLGIGSALLLASGNFAANGISTAIIAVGWFGLTYYLFVKNCIVCPVVSPAGTVLFTYVGVTAWRYAFEEREKRRIKMLFQRYVSPDIVDEVTSGGALHLGGEKRKISALFADVRNFTPLAESLSPEDVVQFLNSFFSKIVTVIFNHQGTLDKFIGDAIMVVFGAPLEQQDQEQRAVDTALDMLRVAKQHSEEIQKQGKPGFEIGIGIASGDAVVGNIGSLRRMEYTAIGDTVNLAARLEELAPGGEVWVTESIHEHCKIPEDSVCGPGKEITVKGKTQSQLVYAIKLCSDK